MSPRITRPELTKQDFVVPGEINPDHYKYPFTHDLTARGNIIGPVPDQLPLRPGLEHTLVGTEGIL